MTQPCTLIGAFPPSITKPGRNESIRTGSGPKQSTAITEVDDIVNLPDPKKTSAMVGQKEIYSKIRT